MIASLMGSMTNNPGERTEDEWREVLSPERFHILREAGTERPWTGELLEEDRAGLYTCGGCGAELFTAGTKFDSHCGWPSFYTPLAGDRIVEIEDRSHGMLRTEVRCASCGSHLGHVFEGEGYATPTDLRYCINSASIELEKKDDAKKEEKKEEFQHLPFLYPCLRLVILPK